MSNTQFFLFRLDSSEAAKSCGEIEVQLLDSSGRAKEVVFVSIDAEAVTVGGREYPRSLLDRVSSIAEGKGMYVNEFGEDVQPF